MLLSLLLMALAVFAPGVGIVYDFALANVVHLLSTHARWRLISACHCLARVRGELAVARHALLPPLSLVDAAIVPSSAPPLVAHDEALSMREDAAPVDLIPTGPSMSVVEYLGARGWIRWT